ncbi:MAG: 3'(2'),5'-bisphosphate nucleotidase CysQ [Dehalococcoidia bacterium]
MTPLDRPAPTGASGGAIDLDAVREGLEAAVRAAGEAILEVARRPSMKVRHKGWEGPVTEADYASDDVLHRMLMPLIPGAHWISEESEQDAPLVHGEPTWVVDPLDGTREFVRGLPEFGVTVGLFVDDRLVLGAAGLPSDGVVMTGLLDGERREARRNGEPMPALDPDREVQRVVVSRNDYERHRIHLQLPWDVYPCGSAVVKLAHAADGSADVYFSTGPRSIWDVAGGTAVLEAVGGTVLQFNGRPLVLSPRQVRVPPYAAGSPGAALGLLRRLGARV